VIHNESLFLDSCSSFRMLWPGYSPEPKNPQVFTLAFVYI